ncbi:MAG: acyl-CoA synthetase [Thermosulfidibacteraceae bacterium]|jgi:2-aminobenzoate-CoA ligase
MGRIPENYLPPRELWPSYNYPDELKPFLKEPTNIADILLDRHIRAGLENSPAIYFAGKKLTYGEVYEGANRIANALKELGVEPQDRIALRMVNCPEAIIANFAIMKVGAIPVPTSPLWSKDEIGFVFNNAEAKYAFISFPLLEEAEKAKDALKYTKAFIVVGGNPQEVEARGHIPFSKLLEKGSSERVCEPMSLDDIGVILYTSGTTGFPKGVAHFVREVISSAYLVNKYVWRLVPGDVLGGSAPVSFAAGYGTFAIIPWFGGAAISLIGKFEPDILMEDIQKNRVTVLTGLPTAYRRLLQMPNFDQYDISSLRMCTSGGDALGVETYKAWLDKTGLPIYEGLGATEMVHLITSNAVNMKAKPGSIGIAIPGYDIKVLTDDGKECVPGEIGKLTVLGPTGPLYWKPYEDNNRLLEEQKKAVVDGRIRLGDAVYMDEDGYYFFVSRESDMIKSSGYRIGPGEVEEALKKHPAVKDAGVIGSPDPIRGEIVKAFIVLKEGYTGSENLAREIVESCKEYIAIYKLPRAVVFCQELPVTPTGKVLRRTLKEWDKEERYPTIRISQ